MTEKIEAIRRHLSLNDVDDPNDHELEYLLKSLGLSCLWDSLLELAEIKAAIAGSDFELDELLKALGNHELMHTDEVYEQFVDRDSVGEIVQEKSQGFIDHYFRVKEDFRSREVAGETVYIIHSRQLDELEADFHEHMD